MFKTKSSYDYWVGYRLNQDNEPLWKNSAKVKFIKPSVYYWYADPMIAKIDGDYYVFTEAFHRIKGKGLIAVSKLKRGRLSKPRIILEEPFHMSFPNVFLYNDKYYMIPETSADRSIRIYEMKGNPYSWKLINRIATDKSFVDIAVGFDEIGKPVLFLSEENEDNRLQDKLKICVFSGFPDGCFDINPIYETELSYIERNAGTIARVNNKNYRFSQISGPNFYGKKVCIHEIESLNTNGYSEKTIGEISVEQFVQPKRFFAEGTHTYNIFDELEVVDFVGEVSSWSTFLFSIRNLIRNKILKATFKSIFKFTNGRK